MLSNYYFCLQNRQSPATTINTNTVTKHLSNLSLETSKKVVTSQEFLPGRGLTSNSSSPNLFGNSYHSQENVGGTTYFYVGNTNTDNVPTEEGPEVVRNYYFFHAKSFLINKLY